MEQCCFSMFLLPELQVRAPMVKDPLGPQTGFKLPLRALPFAHGKLSGPLLDFTQGCRELSMANMRKLSPHVACSQPTRVYFSGTSTWQFRGVHAQLVGFLGSSSKPHGERAILFEPCNNGSYTSYACAAWARRKLAMPRNRDLPGPGQYEIPHFLSTSSCLGLLSSSHRE